MKKMLTVSCLYAVTLAGCAHGLDPILLETRLAEDRPELEITDEEIARVLARKPQLKLPARVGVYFEPYVFDGSLNQRGQAWTLKDKDTFLAVGEELRSSGIASELFLISDSFIPPGPPSERLRNLRLAAARHGADAVLILRGAAQVDSYVNALSVLYPTIIGMFLVPGNHCDALFLLEASLWDVRNEYLYLTEGADGRSSLVRPFQFLRNEAALDQARLQALEAFKSRFLARSRAKLTPEALATAAATAPSN